MKISTEAMTDYWDYKSLFFFNTLYYGTFSEKKHELL